MLKVYFTAPTSFNGDLHPQNERIIDLIIKNGAQLLSGEQIIKKDLIQKDQQLSKKEIYKREKELINQADFIVAEVTRPSLGVGAEIALALTQNKPVLALVQEGAEDKISPIIAGNPSDSLFIENYNFDRLPFIISNYFQHIKNIREKIGKFIVIDGGDGSGKTVQSKLLLNYLQKKSLPIKYFDFPQYSLTFHGKTVAKFLRGEFGGINQVSPYLASLAYALDRLSAKEQMLDFLKKGGYILANRYVPSNMAHQGAKFIDIKERAKFLKWIYELEYKVHRLPKEDLMIYLHVPYEISRQLILNKEKRDYLSEKGKDIHEQNLEHLKNTEQMYLSLCQKYKHWQKIDCVENGQLLTPEVIHQKIINLLKEQNIFT